MDATRSLNSVQAVKTETVQTRQLLWISKCTHTHRTGYFIMKIVQQGLYIHGKGRKQRYFLKISVWPSCWRLRNGFATEQWDYCLVTQTILCITNQSNSVSWHVLMVWRKNKKHPVFPRIVNQLFEAWTMVFNPNQKSTGVLNIQLERLTLSYSTQLSTSRFNI